MIMLTRLNGEEFMANADLIEFIEITPDTVITMHSGKKILVSESLETVQNKVIAYKQAIYIPQLKEQVLR
ncbi:MAG: flagellar FlbD family protein [Hyphomonadaceae bacterium]|nr:flagellar FlbD family protein [Clostridia bacterium]